MNAAGTAESCSQQVALSGISGIVVGGFVAFLAWTQLKPIRGRPAARRQLLVVGPLVVLLMTAAMVVITRWTDGALNIDSAAQLCHPSDSEDHIATAFGAWFIGTTVFLLARIAWGSWVSVLKGVVLVASAFNLIRYAGAENGFRDLAIASGGAILVDSVLRLMGDGPNNQHAAEQDLVAADKGSRPDAGGAERTTTGWPVMLLVVLLLWRPRR